VGKPVSKMAIRSGGRTSGAPGRKKKGRIEALLEQELAKEKGKGPRRTGGGAQRSEGRSSSASGSQSHAGGVHSAFHQQGGGKWESVLLDPFNAINAPPSDSRSFPSWQPSSVGANVVNMRGCDSALTGSAIPHAARTRSILLVASPYILNSFGVYYVNQDPTFDGTIANSPQDGVATDLKFGKRGMTGNFRQYSYDQNNVMGNTSLNQTDSDPIGVHNPFMNAVNDSLGIVTGAAAQNISYSSGVKNSMHKERATGIGLYAALDCPPTAAAGTMHCGILPMRRPRANTLETVYHSTGGTPAHEFTPHELMERQDEYYEITSMTPRDIKRLSTLYTKRDVTADCKSVMARWHPNGVPEMHSTTEGWHGMANAASVTPASGTEEGVDGYGWNTWPISGEKLVDQQRQPALWVLLEGVPITAALDSHAASDDGALCIQGYPVEWSVCHRWDCEPIDIFSITGKPQVHFSHLLACEHAINNSMRRGIASFGAVFKRHPGLLNDSAYSAAISVGPPTHRTLSRSAEEEEILAVANGWAPSGEDMPEDFVSSQLASYKQHMGMEENDMLELSEQNEFINFLKRTWHAIQHQVNAKEGNPLAGKIGMPAPTLRPVIPDPQKKITLIKPKMPHGLPEPKTPKGHVSFLQEDATGTHAQYHKATMKQLLDVAKNAGHDSFAVDFQKVGAEPVLPKLSGKWRYGAFTAFGHTSYVMTEHKMPEGYYPYNPQTGESSDKDDFERVGLTEDEVTQT